MPDWASEDGSVTLFLGDCLKILPTLAPGSVDAVVTDPPYGVNGSSGTIGKSRWHKTRYSGAFNDTLDTLDTLDTQLIPAVVQALQLAGGRGIVTPGNRAVCHYPDPAEMGMIHQPATVSLGPWGRMQSQPILFYGRDPMVGIRIQDTVYKMTERASSDLHPCAKPIGFCLWCVQRATRDGETVLDPFMGSGTTGVACVRLGRRFIGIEIERKYFEIAKRRIQDELVMPLERAATPRSLLTPTGGRAADSCTGGLTLGG